MASSRTSKLNQQIFLHKVCILSLSGLFVNPGGSFYTASKHAVVGFAKSLAVSHLWKSAPKNAFNNVSTTLFQHILPFSTTRIYRVLIISHWCSEHSNYRGRVVQIYVQVNNAIISADNIRHQVTFWTTAGLLSIGREQCDRVHRSFTASSGHGNRSPQ